MTERMRRYRARQKRGDMCLSIEIPAGVVDGLVALGWLDDDTRHDRAAVLQALGRVLERVFDRRALVAGWTRLRRTEPFIDVIR